jgi:hypothetical protein
MHPAKNEAALRCSEPSTQHVVEGIEIAVPTTFVGGEHLRRNLSAEALKVAEGSTIDFEHRSLHPTLIAVQEKKGRHDRLSRSSRGQLHLHDGGSKFVHVREHS